MKGIYYSEGLDFSGTDNVGIEGKVLNQIKYLKSFSKLIVINTNFPKTFREKVLFLLPGVKSQREKNREEILDKMSDDVDFVYIRKPSLTIKFYNVLKQIKREYPNVFILLEIPTFPFHSEYVGISKLMALKSIHCESRLKTVVDKIITYSDDEKIWGIPTIRMSNCVVYDDIPMRSDDYAPQKNSIRLTCVANFMYWHGLDRLIEGARQYSGDYDIVINIVGGGNEIKNLKKLSEGMENVRFHGPKTGKMLDRIFDETDIAVDALGRHRSGVYYNSSLKGKEYAARGIPIISAVKTELDFIPNFQYYLRLPADETPINMDNVISFYNDIYCSDNNSDISKTIRKLTKPIFDYKSGFGDIVYNELEAYAKQKN